MNIKSVITHRLIKNEDLNHHRTLFAGRCSEWFVESSFIAIATCLPVDRIVCLKIHGLEFLHPVYIGDILVFESKIVMSGKSTLTTYTRVCKDNTPDTVFCDGFVTFVHVDEKTKPQPHGLIIELSSKEDLLLQEEAKRLILNQNMEHYVVNRTNEIK